jgi:hypothetical protein
VIVWLNGAFGVGKTATAAALSALLEPSARVWDPESVGSMLRSQLSDLQTGDFQDWPSWRKVVVATASAIHEQTGQLLIAAQSVLERSYFDEVVDGLAAKDVPVFHVLLDASTGVLRDRVLGDPDAAPRAWRLARLSDFVDARDWLGTAADLIVHTDAISPAAAAIAIAESLPGPRRS